VLPHALNQPGRVLMTIDAVGGVWRYGVDLARALGASGTECVLIGCGPAPNDTQWNECRSLRNVTLTWAELPLDWMVADEAAVGGVGESLIEMAQDWNPDLLHLNLPSQAADIPHGIPVAVTSHSCIATWWASVKGTGLPPAWQWQHSLTGRGLKRADAVMVPTASHGDAVSRVYGPIANLHIVPNCTTMADIATGKQPMIFAAGRWWDEGKGVKTLDAAAARVNWPVVMAGSLIGPDGQTAMLHNVRSVGELSADATRAIMRRTAIFASPAIYEPFGLAVLEAAASGAALVLSDIPSFRELWEDAALFATPGDPDCLAAAINRLVESPDLRHTLAENARCRACDFTPQGQVERVLSVYNQVVAARAPAAATAW
jgi:glycosyltransferase involved in cell wall biosynthesis